MPISTSTLPPPPPTPQKTTYSPQNPSNTDKCYFTWASKILPGNSPFPISFLRNRLQAATEKPEPLFGLPPLPHLTHHLIITRIQDGLSESPTRKPSPRTTTSDGQNHATRATRPKQPAQSQSSPEHLATKGRVHHDIDLSHPIDGCGQSVEILLTFALTWLCVSNSGLTGGNQLYSFRMRSLLELVRRFFPELVRKPLYERVKEWFEKEKYLSNSEAGT